MAVYCAMCVINRLDQMTSTCFQKLLCHAYIDRSKLLCRRFIKQSCWQVLLRYHSRKSRYKCEDPNCQCFKTGTKNCIFLNIVEIVRSGRSLPVLPFLQISYFFVNIHFSWPFWKLVPAFHSFRGYSKWRRHRKTSLLPGQINIS